jgi:glycosyltransferase involved in cell wall biosynthesis
LNLNGDIVTVVIPVYNSEKFLKESIESILDQTYKNIEIIVIDDGSTDKSFEILKKYSPKIILLSQNNQGLASALNVGINKMSGKWFKWFSPDDILYPNAIETLVTEIKKFSENTIVYSNWELINENNTKLRDFKESNYNDLGNFEFNVRLLDGQQINVNTTLIPSSLFEKGCQIQELKDPVAIDYDLFLRAGILYDTNFHLIPKSLLKYRIHTSQLSHQNIVNSLSYLSEVKNQILSKLDNSKKEKYLTALQEYDKKKSISKKTMETSLKIATKTLPEGITNRLVTFYLNKIRRTR